MKLEDIFSKYEVACNYVGNLILYIDTVRGAAKHVAIYPNLEIFVCNGVRGGYYKGYILHPMELPYLDIHHYYGTGKVRLLNKERTKLDRKNDMWTRP